MDDHNAGRYATEDAGFYCSESDTIIVGPACCSGGDSTEMSKFNHILAALLLCVAGLAAYGQDSPFKAEIKLAQTTVNNYEAFSVATAIRNTSTEEQTLDIWSCSYPTQWVSDVSSVHVNLVGCKKNDLLHIKLKPGEACERAVTIRIQLSPGDGKP